MVSLERHVLAHERSMFGVLFFFFNHLILLVIFAMR
jgi:hypothetical protein